MLPFSHTLSHVSPSPVPTLLTHTPAGLTASQLQHLARDGHSAVKAARRDVALVVSQGITGATTVSATMLLAHKVGIPVFVTGGIGGVHRRGESSKQQ
ncbi:unnamed protein product [Closterium sp. NIES-54]